MTRFLHILKRFREDEEGTVAIELVLVVPVLVWVLLSTLVYFDVYRAEAISNRAALTMADMVSREQDAINGPYLTGMRELLQVLAETDEQPGFRLTVFTYDQPTDQYSRIWSRRRDWPGGNLTNAALRALSAQLPIMATGDRAILLETRMQYSAPFSVGISPFGGPNFDGFEFETFTVISPRFINRLCFDTDPASNADALICDP